MTEHQHCRSCAAPILWRRNAKSGKAICLDAAPSEKGNYLILDERSCRIVTKADPAPEGAELRLSHFATCPQREQWKRT